MKKPGNIIFCLSIIFLIVSSWGCSEELGSVLPLGTDTLTSEVEFAGEIPLAQGFNFAEGRIIFESYVAAGGLDLALTVQTNASNFPIGGTFILPNNRPFIVDMGNVALQDITEAPADGYSISLINVLTSRAYCIWTSDNKYAKIYVNDVVLDTRQNGSPYIRIRFDWEYQPDGSRYF